MTAVFQDADIAGGLDAAAAVRWMGEAVDADHRGELIAPPSAHVELGDGRLVFTTGRLRGSWFGYRSYDSFPTHPGGRTSSGSCPWARSARVRFPRRPGTA